MATHFNGFMIRHSNMMVILGLLRHSIGKMAFSIEGAHTQWQKQNQTICVLIQRSREPSLLYTLLQWFFSIFKHHSRYFMKHLLSAKQQQVATGHDESCPSAGCVAHGWRWLVRLAGHHSYTAPPYFSSVQPIIHSWESYPMESSFFSYHNTYSVYLIHVVNQYHQSSFTIHESNLFHQAKLQCSSIHHLSHNQQNIHNIILTENTKTTSKIMWVLN